MPLTTDPPVEEDLDVPVQHYSTEADFGANIESASESEDKSVTLEQAGEPPDDTFLSIFRDFLKFVQEFKVSSSDCFLSFENFLLLFPYHPGKLRVKIPEQYLKIRPSMAFGHL